ncbi:hypothetical protein ACFC3A_12570 [Enterococcus thailandicus]|uniref:hypothetical protein n=1 Tax=Enterococcus thailandicus TaxID=417368 RepID=UPI0039A56ED4
MSELKKELEQDKDFVEEVSNRIYSDTDDIDEYMPEPEWIDRMTDIADKYITRFELAQKLVDKHLSSKHLQLNDNQQIVFEWLKEQRVQKNGLILPPFEIISNLLTYVQQNGDDIFRCFALMSEKEQAEVLAAFTQWALEQEEAE